MPAEPYPRLRVEENPARGAHGGYDILSGNGHLVAFVPTSEVARLLARVFAASPGLLASCRESLSLLRDLDRTIAHDDHPFYGRRESCPVCEACARLAARIAYLEEPDDGGQGAPEGATPASQVSVRAAENIPAGSLVSLDQEGQLRRASPGTPAPARQHVLRDRFGLPVRPTPEPEAREPSPLPIPVHLTTSGLPANFTLPPLAPAPAECVSGQCKAPRLRGHALCGRCLLTLKGAQHGR